MCCLFWFVYPVSGGCGSWKKLQVGEDDDWDGKGGRLFDCLVCRGRSCAADQWVMGGRGIVFLRNFRTAPGVEESRAAGMRIIQQWLSWENNYASDLCWDLCGLRSQTFERCQSCRCKQPPWISCDKHTCPLDLVFAQRDRNHRVTTALQLLSWRFLPPGYWGFVI